MPFGQYPCAKCRKPRALFHGWSCGSCRKVEEKKTSRRQKPFEDIYEKHREESDL